VGGAVPGHSRPPARQRRPACAHICDRRSGRRQRHSRLLPAPPSIWQGEHVDPDFSSVERLPVGDEEAWLRALPRQQPDVPGVHRVRELLPPGYDAYLRLFHPFLRRVSPDVPASYGAQRNTWLRLAKRGATRPPSFQGRSTPGRRGAPGSSTRTTTSLRHTSPAMARSQAPYKKTSGWNCFR